MRRRRFLACGATCATGLAVVAGCGSSTPEPPKATSTATQPAGSQRTVSALTRAQANVVPLHVTQRVLEQLIGPPASTRSRQVKGGRQICWIYPTTDQPANVHWQFCFLHDDLQVISSLITER